MTRINEAVLQAMAWAQTFGRDEEGQGLAEYGLILALCSILAVGALGTLSGGINGVLGKVGGALAG